MTLYEIMFTLQKNVVEMHKYDRCYLTMERFGLAKYFNCHISHNCANQSKCPYSCKV